VSGIYSDCSTRAVLINQLYLSKILAVQLSCGVAWCGLLWFSGGPGAHDAAAAAAAAVTDEQ